MADYQRQLQALSEQCLSHEMEDQLTASEIRFNRKQLQQEYDILINAFEFLQEKRARLLKELLNRQDEEDVAAYFKKKLHCLGKVVEDQSPTAIKYTRKHLEEDYGILMYAFMELQEGHEYIYMQLLMSQSDQDKALAESKKQAYDKYQIVQPGDLKDMLRTSEKQFTRQQLKEDHDTLIKGFKDLQEKHEFLLKMSIRKSMDDEDLTDPKNQSHRKYQRGLTVEQDCGSVVSEIKFTRKDLEDEYDALIKAFEVLQAKQICLLEQEKQEDLTKQHHTKCYRGFSHEEHYELMASKLKFAKELLQEEYNSLIEAFKELHAKACLLDQQTFVLLQPEENPAGSKKHQRSEFDRGLSNEEYQEMCILRVEFIREQLKEDYETLIRAFKDFQAKQTSLLGEQTIRHMKMKQEENPSGPKRQYRTEYERGLSKVVKDHFQQAVNPELQEKIELLINFHKTLQTESANWLEELCSRPAEEEVDMKGSKKQWYYVYDIEEVQLPQNVHLELEGTIERLVTARQNLNTEEASLLEELSRRRHAEEKLQTDSKKHSPSNLEEDWLLQAGNPDLETKIQLLINTRKNFKAELAGLSSTHQPVERQALTDSKKKYKSEEQVQGGEQVQDLSSGIEAK